MTDELTNGLRRQIAADMFCCLPLGAFAVNILIIDDIRNRAFDAAKE